MPPPIPDKIPCTSAAQLEIELKDIRLILGENETEDNWEKIARGLQKLASITRGGAAKIEPEFVKALKELSRPMTSAMCSERTRLSGAACDVLATIAPRLAERFEGVMPLFMPELLKLCTRTNKLFISRAQKIILLIVSNNKPISLLPYLREAVKDKSQTLRLAATEATLACLNEYPEKGLRSKIEDVEAILRTTVRDSHPDVRKFSKKIFEVYKMAFADRVDDFSNPLTPITKRYLDIAPRQAGAGPSKAAGSAKPTHPPPVDSGKPRRELAASTSALPNPDADGNLANARSTSSSAIRIVGGTGTALLDKPVRPRLAASQTDRPRLPAAVSATSVVESLQGSRSRATSASSGPTSRPPSALAAAALAKSSGPVRPIPVPFDPRRAQNGPAQQGPVRPTKDRTVSASSSSSTIGAAQRTERAPSTTSNAGASHPVRPTLTRPPTAPAALVSSSAPRRPLHPVDPKKGPTPGKSVLQGGAKRIKTGKPVTPLVQGLRREGFVPKRGTSKAVDTPASVTEKALPAHDTIEEQEDDQDIAGPDVVESDPFEAVFMEAVRAEDAVLESIEEQAPAQNDLQLEDLQVDRVQPATDALTDSPEAIEEVVTEETPSEEPASGPAPALLELAHEQNAKGAEYVVPVALSTPNQKEVGITKSHRKPKGSARQMSPATKARLRSEREQAHVAAMAEAARAARREGRKKNVEGLSAEELEARRHRKREKKERKAREQGGHSNHVEAKSEAILELAVATPLPDDDEELGQPPPAVDLQFAVSIPLPDDDEVPHPLTMADLDFAASIPLPDDDDILLRGSGSHSTLAYIVSLPSGRFPAPGSAHNSVPAVPTSPKSRSSTPDEANYSGDSIHSGGTDDEEDREDFAGTDLKHCKLRVSTPTEENGDGKDKEVMAKEVKSIVGRVFAEVDVNVPFV